jgi:RNA polymerase sigma factor (sigma-70 family)
MSRNALAWSWVIEHRSVVDRVVARVARSTSTSLDDLRSATILRLVEKFERFDPDLGTASTWIYWTAREVATRSNRKVIPIADYDVDRVPGPNRIEERLDARRLADRARSEASEGQMAAVESVAEGWSRDEVEERLGCSLATRNARVYRLRDRLRSLG